MIRRIWTKVVNYSFCGLDFAPYRPHPLNRTEISPPIFVLPVPLGGTTSLNLGHPEFIRGGFFLGFAKTLYSAAISVADPKA